MIHFYTYEIEYVNDKDQRRSVKWNNSCSSLEETMQLAIRTCDRFHAKYGTIKLIREDGAIVKLEWFDKVLN